MGGAQSSPTRKISIPNEESHFIKVSESVAERLRKCTEGSPDQLNQPSKDECPPTEFEKQVRNIENIPPNRQPLPGDPWLNYYFGPSITSIRVLQEKEKELKESEDYWTRRIQNMENHHSRLSQIMEEEYAKAVKEISCQAPRPPPNTPFPCCDEKNVVVSCYKKNPKEILLCAGEVSQFADCVHSKRITEDNRTSGCDEE